MKDNDLKLLLISILTIALLFTCVSALTSRIKRLENDLEDLRVRVIYGVKP